jgi:hypothetical protein
MAGAHGLQDTEDTRGIHVGCKLGRIEAHLNMALRRQVVYFIGADLIHHFDDGHGIAQVCKMQMKMRLSFQVRNPFPKVH